MNESILTICIPTYNRSNKICKQVEKIFELFKNHKKYFELIIVNNCSSDDTLDALSKMKLKYNFTIVNNKMNIGMMRNILKSYSLASAEFTWVLGDDDDISKLDINDLFYTLNNNKAVSLFQFDCKVIDGITNEITKDYFYFGIDKSVTITNSEFVGLINYNGYSSSMWISGNIFRSSTVLKGIEVLNNTLVIALPLFYSIYSALSSDNVVILKSNQIVMTINTTSWGKKLGSQIPIIDLNLINKYLNKSNNYVNNLINPITYKNKVFYRLWFDVFYNQSFTNGLNLLKLSLNEKCLRVIDLPIIFTYGLSSFLIKKEW